MKLIRPFVSSVVAGGIAIAMLTSLAAQAAEQGMAKVVNIRGSARYMTTENPTWRPLRSGATLQPGTILQTAAGSHVDLVFNNPKANASASMGLSAADPNSPTPVASMGQRGAEQDAVRVFENTVLGIDKLTVTQTGADRVTETQLDLKAGRILGTVKKLSAASTYEVKIPNGVAGIRGTIYVISADGVLSVLSGSVVLAFVGPDGTPVTKEIKAGEQYDAKTGQVSLIPESEVRNLWNLANQLRVGQGVPPTTFTVDHTVYYVSPTTASTGGGGSGASEG
jgi:hypothetical protein